MTKENKRNLIITAAVVTVVIVIYLNWDKIKSLFKKEIIVEEKTVYVNTGTKQPDSTGSVTQTSSEIKLRDSVIAGPYGAGIYSEDLKTKLLDAKKGEYLGVVYGIIDSGYKIRMASGKGVYASKLSVRKK